MATAVRCDVCENCKDEKRPSDCEQIVRFTCVGPKISPQLAQARSRIAELERTVRTLQTAKSATLEPFHCQCCGQKVTSGGECGC